MRRSCATIVSVLLFGLIVATSEASASSAVSVVRCDTTQGVPGKLPATPSQIEVLGSRTSDSGLAAYTNTETYVIAPAGMSCSGLLAADGNTSLTVSPEGSPNSGITLSSYPGCVGCQAAAACPFLKTFAEGLGFPCKSSVPAGETTRTIGTFTTLFHDPAGLKGDGWHSGGQDPANGLVAVGAYNTVYDATCTLPSSEKNVCTVSLSDMLRRYDSVEQTGSRSCAAHPAPYRDVQITDAPCRFASIVLKQHAESIPLSSGLGFTLDSFRCRAPGNGAGVVFKHGTYRCASGRMTITWKFKEPNSTWNDPAPNAPPTSCSIHPDGDTDVKVSNTTCADAYNVLTMPAEPVPNSNNLRFTLGNFECRVTQEGSENSPKPALYRCENYGTVITWAFHP